MSRWWTGLSNLIRDGEPVSSTSCLLGLLPPSSAVRRRAAEEGVQFAEQGNRGLEKGEVSRSARVSKHGQAKQDASELQEKSKGLKERMQAMEAAAAEADGERDACLKLIGNLVHDSVPVSDQEVIHFPSVRPRNVLGIQ